MKTVKIMSYNIHSGIGMDEKIDYARMAGLIGKYAPQVVGIQEVAQSHPRAVGIYPLLEMGNFLNMKGEFGKTICVSRPEFKYDYGIGFLTSFNYEYLGKIDLPNIEKLEPRVAQFVKIKAPAEFIFVNTHLGICPSDAPAAHILRRDQLLAINQEMDRLQAEYDLPCVITGDFNAQPSSPCIDLLSSTWDVTDMKIDTFPADEPRIKIDYIATRGKVKCLSYEVIAEKVISDHRPILAELEFA